MSSDADEIKHMSLPSDEPLEATTVLTTNEEECAHAADAHCDRKWLVLGVVMFAQVLVP